jgi:hypothetical protein
VEIGTVSNLFRSLLLTAFLSFTTPIIFVGGLLACLSVMGYLPTLGSFSHTAISQTLDFLAAFGSGYPVQGTLVIGLTCSVVGGFFDLFNFCFYQSLRDH